jgi:hypothetical protein
MKNVKHANRSLEDDNQKFPETSCISKTPETTINAELDGCNEPNIIGAITELRCSKV